MMMMLRVCYSSYLVGRLRVFYPFYSSFQREDSGFYRPVVESERRETGFLIF